MYRQKHSPSLLEPIDNQLSFTTIFSESLRDRPMANAIIIKENEQIRSKDYGNSQYGT